MRAARLSVMFSFELHCFCVCFLQKATYYSLSADAHVKCLTAYLFLCLLLFAFPADLGPARLLAAPACVPVLMPL
jgi:hypothetical protein